MGQRELSQQVERVLERCYKRAGQMDYTGYDPYDALSGYTNWRFLGKWPPVLAIQAFKRLPINLRPFFGIRRAHNPKALGLVLHAIALRRARTEDPGLDDVTAHLLDLLEATRSPGFAHCAWGYPFPWASPVKFLEPFSPTSVVTGFVSRGLAAWMPFDASGRCRQMLDSAAQFVGESLAVTAVPGGKSIAYSTRAADFCLNASLLGAEVLALSANSAKYSELIADTVRAVLHHQQPGGWWHYSYSLPNFVARTQTDFHQGYVCESLLNLRPYLNDLSAEIDRSVTNGLNFYFNNQFASNGQSFFRLPEQRPCDTHHQAQGIICASRFGNCTHDQQLTHRLVEYALSSLWDEKRGYFIYRWYGNWINRIDYFRWCTAWMMLAFEHYKTSARD